MLQEGSAGRLEWQGTTAAAARGKLSSSGHADVYSSSQPSSNGQPARHTHRRLRSKSEYTRPMLPLTSASTSGGMEGEL